jgi:hypothetical protein
MTTPTAITIATAATTMTATVIATAIDMALATAAIRTGTIAERGPGLMSGPKSAARSAARLAPASGLASARRLETTITVAVEAFSADVAGSCRAL